MHAGSVVQYCGSKSERRKIRTMYDGDRNNSDIPQNTGCFIMFFVITNIYNKKTKGPTLMELFTATGKLKKSFLGGQLEYHIDVCRVTLGTHIEHL